MIDPLEITPAFTGAYIWSCPSTGRGRALLVRPAPCAYLSPRRGPPHRRLRASPRLAGVPAGPPPSKAPTAARPPNTFHCPSGPVRCLTLRVCSPPAFAGCPLERARVFKPPAQTQGAPGGARRLQGRRVPLCVPHPHGLEANARAGSKTRGRGQTPTKHPRRGPAPAPPRSHQRGGAPAATGRGGGRRRRGGAAPARRAQCAPAVTKPRAAGPPAASACALPTSLHISAAPHPIGFMRPRAMDRLAGSSVRMGP
jgi:hypothetical protein